MNLLTVKADCESIGKAFAHAGDVEQAEVLNSMARELTVSCGGRHADVETQHCYISDKLDRNGAEFIKSLAAFIELREKTKP